MSEISGFALSGYARSGKDAVADILTELYGYRKTYMSKPLEQALLALDAPIPLMLQESILAVNSRRASFEEELLTGWPGIVTYPELHAAVGYDESKREYWVRHLLQKLGTEVGRVLIHENVWLDKILEEIMLSPNEYESPWWCVTGVRYPNEMEALREIPGLIVWINRPGIKPINNHSSDNTIGPDDCDLVLSNNGTLADLAVACQELHNVFIRRDRIFLDDMNFLKMNITDRTV